MRLHALTFLVTAALVSCGAPSTSMPTPSDDSDAGTTPVAIAEPLAPAPPSLMPCPDGWSVRAVGTAMVCEPWPATGAADCAAAEAHLAGEAGCRLVGAPCPSSDFPADLPTDRPILYVQPGAPTGGDGSIARPFSTVADARAAATAGTIIALAKGRYDEAVLLGTEVTLWGACARDTVVVASAPSTGSRPAVLIANGRGAIARNVTIGASPRVGIWVSLPVSLELDGVAVESAQAAGIYVGESGTLTAHELVVRDIRGGADGSPGFGVVVEHGGSATLTRVVVERTEAGAVIVNDPGSRVVLEDIAIRDTRIARSGDGGAGLQVALGASAEIRRGVVEGSREVAVVSDSPGTSLVMSDVVVRDTLGGLADQYGEGIKSQHGGSIHVERAFLERNRYVGVHASVEASSIELVDVVVRDTQPQGSDGRLGSGLQVDPGCSASVVRALFESNRLGGMVVAGGSLRAQDVALRDGQSDEVLGLGGVGLAAIDGASVDLARALIEHNRSTGIYLKGARAPVVLTATDVVVRDTEGDVAGSDWGQGRGIAVSLGVDAQLARVLLEHNREASIVSEGGGVVRAEDITIRDTFERACATTSCADASAGLGITAMGPDAIDLRRFVIARSPLCGVLIARDGTAALHQGSVVENAIGACVQREGFDVAGISDAVVYRDNGTNLQTTELPVPSAVGDLLP